MKILLFCLAALPAFAQQIHHARPTQTAIERRPLTADSPPEELAKERTKALVGQLNLTPAQTAQVHTMALAKAKDFQAVLRRFENGEMLNMHNESVRSNRQFEASLSAILTPNQHKQRQKMLASIRRIQPDYDVLE